MSRSTLAAALLAVLASPIKASPIEKPSGAAYDMPLTWTPFGFTTDTLTLGTPPQKIPSFVDWTWIGQYVFSPLCQGGANDTYDCLQPEQPLFNQYESKTFVNQSKLYPPRNWNPNHFFFYDDLSVQHGSDILRVGENGKEKNQARITAQIADMHFQLEYAYPFAGVFGLSPVFKSDNSSTQSPFHQLWLNKGFKSPLTSFIYCYPGPNAPPKSVCNGVDGVQTLGGIRSQNIKDNKIHWFDNLLFPPVNVIDFEYHPAIYNYWAIPVTKFKIGDEDQKLNLTYKGKAGAIFDHASYGRGAPVSTNAYKKLIEKTKAWPVTLTKEERPNNGNQSDYAVDCAKVDTFPTLKYGFDGREKEWAITGRNYVEKVNETCVLNVRTLGEGDFQIGNFGETFARDKVIIFDFEKLKVGLADVKW